jgi:hypothetical protein
VLVGQKNPMDRLLLGLVDSGHILGRARPGQDALTEDNGRRHSTALSPPATHARHAARRHHRHHDLQPAQPQLPHQGPRTIHQVHSLHLSPLSQAWSISGKAIASLRYSCSCGAQGIPLRRVFQGRIGVFTSASPRCLDGGNVDLLHRHHRLEGTLGLTATRRKRIG